jgi:hypothetical protein
VGPSAEPRSQDTESPPADDPAARVASVVKEGLDIWSAQARSWYARSTERRTWSPEDVVGDYTNLIEHLTPLLERTIDLSLELLRPRPPGTPKGPG